MQEYGKVIARPDQVTKVKDILTASPVMKARDLAESCREYKLMRRIHNFGQ